ncbi:hypothetical protein [Shewanella aquimarina]|uniref:hypothetical protein n=1 Tax=Shewanella aquimarina TaxID=260365 RepID=UPI002014CBD2|nr:hypothetical protein [Shewanella aquimarina]MCL2910004.1 hypothetical protein [Shewanella aquimarina]
MFIALCELQVVKASEKAQYLILLSMFSARLCGPTLIEYLLINGFAGYKGHANMSDQEIKQVWDVGLSPSESKLLGLIVAHWGAIEGEVFQQALESYGVDFELSELPKEMNNLSFSKVLEVWKERVIAGAPEADKVVLKKQYEKIRCYQDYRNSLIHGMWIFDRNTPEVISTLRGRGKEIISAVFEEGQLQKFYSELAQINLYIRYPRGMEQVFEEQFKQGYYVNEAEIRRMKLRKKG